MLRFFTSLLIFGSLVGSNVESLEHDADGLAMLELQDVFGTTTFEDEDTRSGGSQSCPNGESIIWGYTFMYSTFESNSCFQSNNRVCDVGASSCSASECAHQGAVGSNDDIVGRIVLLCGPKTIPGAYAKSQIISNGASSSLTCDGEDTIVHGFKYAYASSTCAGIVNVIGACDVGARTCTADGLGAECLDSIIVTMILCAPKKYGNALTQYGLQQDKSVYQSATPQKLDCITQTQDVVSTNTGINYGPRTTLLLGTILALAQGYTSEVSLSFRRESKICRYTGQDPECEYDTQDYGPNQIIVAFSLCLPDFTKGITQTPSRQPVVNVGSDSKNMLVIGLGIGSGFITLVGLAVFIPRRFRQQKDVKHKLPSMRKLNSDHSNFSQPINPKYVPDDPAMRKLSSNYSNFSESTNPKFGQKSKARSLEISRTSSIAGNHHLLGAVVSVQRSSYGAATSFDRNHVSRLGSVSSALLRWEKRHKSAFGAPMSTHHEGGKDRKQEASVASL